MKTARKQFTGAFKAKVALEALKGVQSVNELAGLYQVHPAQIAAWKKRLVEGSPDLLADGRKKAYAASAPGAGVSHPGGGVLRRAFGWPMGGERTVAGTPVALRAPFVPATVAS